jgi:hemerythrin
MEWHENYSIGVEHIDTQHKKLFNILGRLQDSLVAGEQSKEIANSLCFLVSYTKTHFHDEEELMLAIDFEEYDHQKELHQKFECVVNGAPWPKNPARPAVRPRSYANKKRAPYLAPFFC